MPNEALIFASLCTYVICVALTVADCPSIAFPMHADTTRYNRPSSVKKGLEDVIGAYPTGTLAMVVCRGTTDTHIRRCLETGDWSGDEFHCEEFRYWCDLPGSHLGGSVSPYGFCSVKTCETNTVMQYECDPRLHIVGPPTITCLSTGHWSAKPPKCERRPKLSCRDPGRVANAVREEIRNTLKDVPGFGPHDKLIFRCQPGYRFLSNNVYSVSMMCKPRFGGWDHPMPVCEAVTCSSPRAPHFGFVDDKNRTLFEYEETVKYSCKDGYDLIGQVMMSCGQSGWRGRIPHCLIVRCVNPGRPKHGFRSGRSFLPGDTVEFGCSVGYTLLGSAERTCLASRSWNGTLTICDAGNTYCSDPGIPIGGNRIGDKFDLNNTVQFKCRYGYYRRGPSERVCLINREWSGRETFCKSSMSYDDPDEATKRFKSRLNALLENTNLCDQDEEANFTEGNNYTDATNNTDVVNYPEYCVPSMGRALDTSHPGGLDLYLLFDVSGSISEADFKMGVEFAESLVDMLKVSNTIGGTRVGVSSFGGNLTVHLTIYRGDHPDKVKKALREMKLRGGATATGSALHNILTVQIPTALRRSSSTNSKYALILITDGDSNTGGDPVKYATQLKGDHNMDIYVIGVGSKYDKAKLAELASKESQVWNLKGANVFKRIQFGIIGEEIDYDECGIRDDQGMGTRSENLLEGLHVKDPETWPWMVGLYKWKGKKFVHICGGTLIEKQWVLTAAHCFEKKDIATKYKIIYGQPDRDSHDNYHQDILAILPHPNFTFTNNVYDNDVALLWLTKPIRFGSRARAVCLPDEFEGDVGRNWYTSERSHGYVLGWGSRKRLKAGKVAQHETLLKAVLVNVTKSQTCLQSYIGNRAQYKSAFNSTLMFCAGDGSGRDSCKGDSGGPFLSVVKNIATSIKKVYQIGIVSWSTPGCRLDGQYGVYTRLTRYLPWIRDTMKKKEEIEL